MRTAIVSTVLVLIVIAFRMSTTGSNVDTGIDDANITFTYARNIAQGQGFVFARGGERVEGSTSTAWTLIMAGAAFTTGDHIEWAARGILIILMIASVSLMVVLARELGASPPMTWCAATLYVWTPGVIDWNVLSLLDTGLWTFFVIAGLWCVLGSTVPTTLRYVTWLMLPLIRPEGMLLAPMYIVFHEWRNDSPFSVVRLLRRTAPGILAVATVVLTLVLVRLLYFGQPLPNTYYAKVGPSLIRNVVDGLVYVLRYPLQVTPIPFILLLTAAWIDRRTHRIERTLWLALAGLLAIPIIEGGDHFNYGRFLQPALITAWTMVAIGMPRMKMRTMVCSCIACLLLIQIQPTAIVRGRSAIFHVAQDQLAWEYHLAQEGRKIGIQLGTMFASGPKPTWGVIAAGGSSYGYAAGTCIDLMGLSNVDMAHATTVRQGAPKNHQAFDPATFYRQKPDLLFPHLAAPTDTLRQYYRGLMSATSFESTALRGLLQSEGFRRHYSLCRLSYGNMWCVALMREEWVTSYRGPVTITRIPAPN